MAAGPSLLQKRDPGWEWRLTRSSLKNTEEKWLANLYGQEYIDYCKRVNRCIPWLPRKHGRGE